ncbi:tyrosine-type recombinase/integrase, partial [Cobetia sp. SIMBA_158]
LHPITVHGFRHTHASILFEAGATVKEVQVRLGHRDIKTTMNIYTHVTKTVKERTAELFQSYIDI